MIKNMTCEKKNLQVTKQVAPVTGENKNTTELQEEKDKNQLLQKGTGQDRCSAQGAYKTAG